MPKERYVIGVDYGTDSCRAILCDALTGEIKAEASALYPRWAKGLYCDPSEDRYRQHPLDYIETFRAVIAGILEKAGTDAVSRVEGISFDTTASTPVLVDGEGVPLSLKEGFSDDPDAMFVLWKDHTAKEEADDINALAHSYHTDYTLYSGGTYSAEWAWSKVLHLLRSNPRMADAAVSWMEHCDWISAWLTGGSRPEAAARSRCAAGHKAMWNEKWGGLPSEDFLSRLHPALGRMRATFRPDTVTADACVGVISPVLASELGLPATLKVGLGSIDAHVGAVGASIAPNVLTRIMGTSTCDILVAEPSVVGDRCLRGICGQVDGSVVPGYIGFEAGQSAFGDVFAWFRKLLCWSVERYCPEKAGEVSGRILFDLEKEAAKVGDESSVLALDWFNGRRTPDADQLMKGAVSGLTLGTTAPMVYKALVEAVAFGSKAILDRFVEEGVRIDSVLAIGGISQKSDLVMQTLADVLGRSIQVVDCPQSCALGAAMFASVAAGIHPDVPAAQKAMASPLGKLYVPSPGKTEAYSESFARYKALGAFVEGDIRND